MIYDTTMIYAYCPQCGSEEVEVYPDRTCECTNCGYIFHISEY